MIKILANDGIHPDGKTLLEEAGYQVDTDKIPQDQLADKLPEYDVVIVRSATKIRKDLIDKCPNLKVIARAGVGLDNVDHQYAKEKGLAVFNTPAASSKAVAELAFTHMFNLARLVHQSNYQMRAADADFKQLKKNYSSGVQLRGKTLAIVGFGRIGQEVARIGLALGMRVMPTDPMVDSADIDITLYEPSNLSLKVTVETVDWEDALTHADFITFHVPGIGKPLLGKEEFARMKNNVIIVNTARGGIVEEQALVEALNEGQVAGAGLDVFENEPTPLRALVEHPKVSVTPHIGASTVEAQANIGLELADKILAFFGDDK
ncbi:D-2-hydroxyacid dehydrogenase [Flavilitoribacter nigricans]|uniref:3-phosphoglycerate dehydrogenase n=1 Tax=Flavilitoribacter nigricans (strain ATCC 23147 / DSM 23189 / NBRC 102662 / NCIMB 1420 / SS-2) TaxID=1122177 RepID=A0A2D0N8G8_FLAN2|nr:D-2-hydroxyacid dehydrogenase [Flavilitoribacter nigricans]PHN04449.1 3-phosphoglycerate dehydrogenase [Flavilitoribacter nigricans DSM 23189 = NBRC 102662]